MEGSGRAERQTGRDRQVEVGRGVGGRDGRPVGYGAREIFITYDRCGGRKGA